jgi:cytidylate kinase
MIMIVITMTREMGSLGKDVAAGLAERLGLKVIHHELVEHGVSELSGLPESDVHRFLEGEASLLERWRVDRKQLSRYTALELLEIAAKGNVLIRGWGATYLLRLIPHVISVRICAPLPFRERVLMARLNSTDQMVARREIARSDATHNGTMYRMFGVDWQDASLYAMTLNTAYVPVPECVEQIALLSKSKAFEETPHARGMLQDQLIEARVRWAVDKDVIKNFHALGIGVQVTDGRVTLTGASSDARLIEDIVRRAQTVDGVVAVHSEVLHMAFAAGYI